MADVLFDLCSNLILWVLNCHWDK